MSPATLSARAERVMTPEMSNALARDGAVRVQRGNDATHAPRRRVTSPPFPMLWRAGPPLRLLYLR